ncbi:MAG: hypothetical protein QOD41_2396 [Cryptosporangiaceae bacterium]|nr:hypothetical protein [Cryptosporangiaceae bacterium]
MNEIRPGGDPSQGGAPESPSGPESRIGAPPEPGGRPQDGGAAKPGADSGHGGGTPEQSGRPENGGRTEDGGGPEDGGAAPDGRGIEDGGGAGNGRGTEAGGTGGSGSPFSGLKNPAAAIRGVAMATLILEAIVLLLAIQPVRIVAPTTPGWGLALLAVLAVVCLLATGLLRFPWGWPTVIAIQVAVITSGLLQYALFLLGGVFLAIWLYVLKLRSELGRPAQFDH